MAYVLHKLQNILFNTKEVQTIIRMQIINTRTRPVLAAAESSFPLNNTNKQIHIYQLEIAQKHLHIPSTNDTEQIRL